MHTGHLIVRALGACALLLAIDAASAAPAADKAGHAGALRDLAQLRRSTAAFHSFDVAAAAGWDVQLTPCDDSPDGAQGIHYGNPDLLFDGGALDPTRPEVLQYEPTRNGGKRLVGVEFIILESDLPGDSPAPELFGQHMHFNAPAGLWALHVWLWRHNPSGMFADWNPKVSCRFAD